MNSPLNPVLKAPVNLPKKAVPHSNPDRKTDRTMARLSMPESFALIEWLKAYKAQPGDTIQTIALAAAASLNNPLINFNHVQQRTQEFGIALPKRVSNAPVMERLSRLEQVLATAIREQILACRKAGIEPHPDLVVFANDN